MQPCHESIIELGTAHLKKQETILAQALAKFKQPNICKPFAESATVIQCISFDSTSGNIRWHTPIGVLSTECDLTTHTCDTITQVTHYSRQWKICQEVLDKKKLPESAHQLWTKRLLPENFPQVCKC